MTNPATTSSNRVTVRMYDMGFGDCFLILIPDRDGGTAKKVLIDCGTAAKGSNQTDDVVRSIISAVTDPVDDQPRIDLVVCTHRHKDHLSGFDNPRWSKVEVKEVWMPWTESLDDNEAAQLRAAQTRFASRMAEHIRSNPALRADGDAQAALDIASLAISNEDAMNTLWHGFAPKLVDGQAKIARRRYLAAAHGPQAFGSQLLPGVDVHVLGPSRDEVTIKHLEPPSDQAYFAASDMQSEKIDPFPDNRVSRFRTKKAYRKLAALFSRKQQKMVDQQGGGPGTLSLTRAFDNAINGTSLVLFLEFGKACLLFMGDAQWGTWEKILESDYYRELLARTDLYKVSHHGSHNGTPVDFVEEVLPKSAKAIVSVGKHGRWPGIPRDDLITALNKATRNKVVRSDKGENPGTWDKKVSEKVGNRSVTYHEIKIVC